jgi:hypothetical protein
MESLRKLPDKGRRRLRRPIFQAVRSRGQVLFVLRQGIAPERNAECENLESRAFATNTPYGSGARDRAKSNASGSKNNHPTLKPLALMRYLVCLFTPPDGTLLGPFAGSGNDRLRLHDGTLQLHWDGARGDLRGDCHGAD